MGWRTAPLLVKVATIGIFVAVAATYGLSAYKPTNPQWPLLIFVSLGMGAFIACIVLFIGNAITHPITKEVARAAVDRRTYRQNNRVPLLQVAILLASASWVSPTSSPS